MILNWEEPRFTDNVGVTEMTRRYTDSVGRTRVFNNLPIQWYYYEPLTVTYTAFDEAGNTNECSFEVILTSGK